MDWISSVLLWCPKWPGLTLLDYPHGNILTISFTMRQFWTSGPSIWHHTNSGRGSTTHDRRRCCFDMCQATKGTHVEMSWTPLTYSKRVRTYTLLNCSCLLCKIFFPYVNFSFISYLSHTSSTVLLPYSSQHLAPQPHACTTRSSSDNETVTATEIFFNKLGTLTLYKEERSSFYLTVDRLCAPHEVQLVNAGWGKSAVYCENGIEPIQTTGVKVHAFYYWNRWHTWSKSYNIQHLQDQRFAGCRHIPVIRMM